MAIEKGHLMPLHAPFDEIDLATLQRLVDDEVPEDRQLEYKRELNLITKEQKREFLADISAFANADGGHLIIGIEEGKGGKKGNVVGATKTNELDQFLTKIQNLIRDGVEPNVHGLTIKPVETGSGEAAIVIFVRQSWSKPHWVSFRGHKIFYSRNSNGKYALDIEELRQLFTLSETAAERIRDFRAERIGAILEGTTPVVMESGPKLVLHVIPFSAGSTRRQFDLSVLPNFLTNSLSHNFEGLFEGTDKEYFHQIFRDGSFEFVYRP
ncbi:MAG: putative DNA binding domain-containing protein, partial [Anaerolineae bacterium]|nr:putative DNA binding domain-containing protein [Anaerolineae bacterium]